MQLNTRGLALKLGVGLLASAAVSGAFFVGSAPARPTPLTPEAFAVLLHRVGLEPRAMAATGITAQQTETVLSRLRADAAEHLKALDAADDAYAQAYAEVDRLQAQVQGGVASREAVSSLASAHVSLAEAKSRRSVLLMEILAVAVHDMNAETVAGLRRIAESPAFDEAIEFKVAVRDQADEVRLRDALACERLARSDRTDVPASAAAVLASERGTREVEAALAHIDANAAAVIAAWNKALRTR